MQRFELWQRYSLQALFIFCTVLLSLLAVTWVLQQVLVREALELEAQSFIDARAQDPAFPAHDPQPDRLSGWQRRQRYLETQRAPELTTLEPGLHESIRLHGLENLCRCMSRTSARVGCIWCSKAITSTGWSVFSA
ncbi:MAG: hypothetical protein R3E89_07950 [Thiolinea sp.]